MISLKKLCAHVLYDNFLVSEYEQKRWGDSSRYEEWIDAFSKAFEKERIPVELKGYIRDSICGENKDFAYERIFASDRNKKILKWGLSFSEDAYGGASFLFDAMAIIFFPSNVENPTRGSFRKDLDKTCFDVARWLFLSKKYQKWLKDRTFPSIFLKNYGRIMESDKRNQEFYGSQYHKVTTIFKWWGGCTKKEIKYKMWLAGKIFS